MADTDISTQIVCRVCKESKQIDQFPRMPTGKHGRTTRCKPCTAVYIKAYQEANKDKLKAGSKDRYKERKSEYQEANRQNYEKNKDAYKERAKKWAKDNPEKRSAVCTKYHFANPEKRAAWGKSSRENNPGMYAAHYKARQQRKRKAMPAWANEENIKAIYRQSAWVSRITGVKHHVDHFYPLKSDIVCGLHNEFNLRIIPAFDNLSKGNRVPQYGSTT